MNQLVSCCDNGFNNIRANKRSQQTSDSLIKQTGIANTFETEEQITNLLEKVGMSREFLVDETVATKFQKIGRSVEQTRSYAGYSILGVKNSSGGKDGTE